MAWTCEILSFRNTQANRTVAPGYREPITAAVSSTQLGGKRVAGGSGGVDDADERQQRPLSAGRNPIFAGQAGVGQQSGNGTNAGRNDRPDDGLSTGLMQQDEKQTEGNACREW